jgi:hypothetical protein
MWRSKAWWLFVGLLAVALAFVLVIAFVTSSPTTSYGGRAPRPAGVSAPAAPYPFPQPGASSATVPGTVQ